MSDYLSTLAARSLRREPACEPRRAQMFEPRTEAHGLETVESAAVETAPTASTPATDVREINERDAGALAEPRAEASPRPAHGPTHAESSVRGRNAHVPPHETSHVRQSEVVPRASEHSSQVEPRGEPVLEATDTPVVRRAQTEPEAKKPVPQASHINVARADELVDSPQPLVSSRRSSSDTARAATLDEKVREETPAVAPRATQFESLNAKSEVNVESTPRPRASHPNQALEAPIRADSAASPEGVTTQLKPAVTSEVLPLPARPATTETRAAALTAPAEYAAPVQGHGAGLNGVQTARELSTQAPPVIEVSIGRIEVRAVTPPAPPPASRQKSAPPRMSLDDYLRAQSGGRS